MLKAGVMENGVVTTSDIGARKLRNFTAAQ